ncbi:MAG TPA: amidohydrolase family protein [Polyangiaceae bacterium]|nr:amidohydrolase family protein [Polyangiaceae bacterium]
MKIDAHQHFWDPSRKDYGWIDDLQGEAARRLRRPILPPELAPLLTAEQVDSTVLVQAAPSDAEGQFLLSLADRHAFIAGVVVWVDMEAPDFEERLGALRSRAKFVGVRPMIHDISDASWMLRRNVQQAFAALERQQICFDFLVRPVHFPPLLEILAAFPRLRAVLDHIGKPQIGARQWEPWATLLERAARSPNLYCKLSGMVTEANHSTWAPADLAPYVRHALQCFGSERCMFGSDWPVCTLAASYSQVTGALTQTLAPLALGAAEQKRIWGGTAAAFYRLSGEPVPPAREVS